MRPIIAIDPGASGGIIYSSYEGIIETFKMPKTPGARKDLLQELVARGGDSVCYIEQVGGYVPRRGADGKMQGQPGSAMFVFGYGVGYLHGVLSGLNCSMVEVAPKAWQKVHNFGSKGGLSDSDWKAKLRVKAEQLFPHVKMTNYLADALLILNYARIQERAGL